MFMLIWDGLTEQGQTPAWRVWGWAWDRQLEESLSGTKPLIWVKCSQGSPFSFTKKLGLCLPGCIQTDINVLTWCLLLPMIQCLTQITGGFWEVSHSLIKLGQGHKAMLRHQNIVLRLQGGQWLDSPLFPGTGVAMTAESGFPPRPARGELCAGSLHSLARVWRQAERRAGRGMLIGPPQESARCITRWMAVTANLQCRTGTSASARNDPLLTRVKINDASPEKACTLTWGIKEYKPIK